MLPKVLLSTSGEKGGLSQTTSVMPSMDWGVPEVWCPSWRMGYQNVLFKCTTPSAS